MTERERWTVYPLLLFTLALVAKDKLFSAHFAQLQVERLSCQVLDVARLSGGNVEADLLTAKLVRGEQVVGTTLVTAPSVQAQEAVLERTVTKQHDAIALKVRDLVLLRPDGQPVGHLSAQDAQGGSLELRAPDGRVLVKLGPDSQNGFGAIATFAAQDKPLVALDAGDRAGQIRVFSHRQEGADPARTVKLFFLADSQNQGVCLATDAAGNLYQLLTRRIASAAPAAPSPSVEPPASEPTSSEPQTEPSPNQEPPPEPPAGASPAESPSAETTPAEPMPPGAETAEPASPPPPGESSTESAEAPPAASPANP